MEDKKVLEAYRLKSENKNADIRGLNLNDQEILLLDEMLHGGQDVPTQPNPTLEAIAENPIGAGVIGALDKGSWEMSDEAWGALSALFSPNDPRPFEEKYREAQRQFAHASESAWEKNKIGYGTGALVGIGANAFSAAKLGLRGIKSAIGMGALTGGGAAKEGEVLEGAALGAASVPVVDKALAPAAKWVGKQAWQKANTLTGDLPTNVVDTVKDFTVGMNENLRTKMREYGAKTRDALSPVKSLRDIPARRDALRTKVQQGADLLDETIRGHISNDDAKIDGILEAVDHHYKSQGHKAVSGKDVATIVQKYIKKLTYQKEWISLNDSEKQKMLGVLHNLKQRVLFKNEKDMLRHADLMNKKKLADSGVKTQEWYKEQVAKAEEEATRDYAKAAFEAEHGVDKSIEGVQKAHDLKAQSLEQRATEKSAYELSKLHGEDLNKAILNDLKELSGNSVSDMVKDQEGKVTQEAAEQLQLGLDNLNQKSTEKTTNIISGGELAKDKAALSASDALAKRQAEIDKQTPNRLFDEFAQGDMFGNKAEAVYQDLAMKELNDIRSQLQKVVYADAKTNMMGTRPLSEGGVVSNPRTAKIFMDMEHDIRNLSDVRSDEATNMLGLGETWKKARERQSNNLRILEKAPKVADLKALSEVGSLTNKSAELSQFMNEPADIGSLHDDIKRTWQVMAPDFEEFSNLAHIDPNRTLSRGATSQFRIGATMEGIKQGPLGQAVPQAMNNYVIPRASKYAPDAAKMILGVVGDVTGIPSAVASEEITNSQNSADDYSMERALGEIAPKLESFMAPSPVLTSKGRARSAIVDGTGTRARIVDPLERNAIRDDVWHDDTMSTIEKMNKVDKLNKTEKVDLDRMEDVMRPTQFYNPQTQEQLPPQDLFGAMNEQR